MVHFACLARNPCIAPWVAFLEATQPPKVRRIVTFECVRVPTFDEWMGAVYVGKHFRHARHCRSCGNNFQKNRLRCPLCLTSRWDDDAQTESSA